MSKQAAPFVTLIVLAIVVICGYRYYDYAVKQNYVMDANTICDTRTENCFISSCDPTVAGCETKPYEKVEMNASAAPACLFDHTCAVFSCPNGSDCAITYCSDDNLSDGESCSQATTTATSTSP